MKSWLIKYKISNALNDRKPLPPAVGRAMARSEELRRFAENSSALNHALKSQLPSPEDCPLLHDSIMRAVRTSMHARAAQKQLAWPRWVPVSSLGLLVLLGALMAIQFFSTMNMKVQPENSQTFAAAGSAIELGGSLVREAPDVAMSPLSDEMQKLDRNLVDAKKFLLASLP
jgi:hypothetical protein